MKQIVYDYIHLTQMEFLLEHPIVVLATFVVIGAIWWVADDIMTKRRQRQREEQHGKEESDTAR